MLVLWVPSMPVCSLSALLFLGFISLTYLLASALCNLVIFFWILEAEKQSA